MAFTRYYPVSSHIYDPSVAPTKPIQSVNAIDTAKYPSQTKPRFDTTYRTEYINRIQNGEQFTKPTGHFKKALNQYSVLPPISTNNNNQNETSDRQSISDGQQSAPFPDQEVPSTENMLPLNLNNNSEYYNQQDQEQQQQQPMMNTEDTFLPEEPVLLTDFEEQRLADQVRSQLGGPGAVDRLKLFYQELASSDPSRSNYLHYSQIQAVAYQLGFQLAEDTIRFAMCKFVSVDRARGFVNYEDLTRFFGKCLTSMNPNQYGNPQQQQRNTPQKQMRSSVNADDFDPDERQIQVLLKQNLKSFDMNGTIDFDKLTRELASADRNQSGVLNRQQIEEVVYKVRIPLQRSLIYQVLEKHCRAYSRLYNWQAFIQYLQQQIFDLKQVEDRSSPIYSQYVPSHNQWLDNLQKEFHEKDRLRVIDRYVTNTQGIRVEETHPQAWFSRFLRFANAMYSHRKNSNVSQEFVLPREEARRLFRAYNHVWDLQIDDNRIQRAFDACSRNGHVVVDDALKQLAK